MEHSTEVITCTNCGEPISGEYCSACGQKRFTAADLSLSALFHSVLKELLTVDNRIFKNLRFLLFSPGTLTLAYISGKQKQFIKPVSLFFLVNAFFFLAGYRIGLLNWNISYADGDEGLRMMTEYAQQHGRDADLYVKELNEVFKAYQRSMFFIIIPLFGAVMSAVMYRQRRYFTEHLIYSIHYHSAYLILLPATVVTSVLLLGLLDKVTGWHLARVIGNEPGIIFLAVGLMVGYHYIALRRVYQLSILQASGTALLVSLISAYIMVPAAQLTLFWLVWWTAK
jgi:hypothetical protein